jgi:hypothetical protein
MRKPAARIPYNSRANSQKGRGPCTCCTPRLRNLLYVYMHFEFEVAKFLRNAFLHPNYIEYEHKLK